MERLAAAGEGVGLVVRVDEGWADDAFYSGHAGLVCENCGPLISKLQIDTNQRAWKSGNSLLLLAPRGSLEFPCWQKLAKKARIPRS